MGSSKPTSALELLEESEQQFQEALQQLKEWTESTSHRYNVKTKKQLDALIQKLSKEAKTCFQQRIENMRSFLREQQNKEKFSGKDRLNEITENLKQTLTILNDPCPENIKNYLERAEEAPGIYISEANKRNYERVQWVLTALALTAFLATWPTLFFSLPVGILLLAGVFTLGLTAAAIGESWGRQIEEGSQGMAATMNYITMEIFNNGNQSITNQLTLFPISADKEDKESNELPTLTFECKT